jgi:IS30 family transposase
VGSSHWSLRERRELLRLVVGGVSVREAAKRRGVPWQTATVWVRLAGVEVIFGRNGGVLSVPVVLQPRVGHGRRLSLADRSRIEAGLDVGMSLREIAKRIGAAPSTVSREVRRAGLRYRSERVYAADVADYHAQRARARPKPAKLDAHPDLRQAVVDGLNGRFSPQQVAGRLPVLFPGREDMRVSHETIYQALYVQGKGALRHELTVLKALRSGRTGRIPQSKLPPKPGRPWLEGARLTDRPAEAADRAVPGHWEGDLVVGPAKSGIVTLVERNTRFALLGRLPRGRDSDTVNEVMTRMIEDLPAALMKTITWDQGTEMAGHAKFTVKTGCPVFFCDPHSPWQRGTNENTNGLIRDFYPKGTNFNSITDDDLAETQRLLNIRPRATLNFATPAEKLNEHINRVALTD